MGENLALVCRSASPSNLRLRNEPAAPLFLSLPAFAKAMAGRQRRGCSSVVEHLLAKEDVASSSLVTRSNLRLSSAQAKAGASAPEPVSTCGRRVCETRTKEDAIDHAGRIADHGRNHTSIR